MKLLLYTSDLLINHTRLSLLEYEIKQVSVKQPGTFFSNSKKKNKYLLSINYIIYAYWLRSTKLLKREGRKNEIVIVIKKNTDRKRQKEKGENNLQDRHGLYHDWKINNTVHTAAIFFLFFFPRAILAISFPVGKGCSAS